jgi:outer membrane protein TolC
MKTHENTRFYRLVAIAAILGLAPTAHTLWAQSPSLSVDRAVELALENDNGIQSAAAAANASVEQAVAARLRLLPTLSLSAGYTRLSTVPQQSLDIPFGRASIPISFPSSPTDSFSLGASLRYPIFAGFRLTEAAKITDLRTMTKRAALEMMREAIAFEVRRIYWQTVRAAADVDLLRKSLDVTKTLVQEIDIEVKQGLATESNRLSAEGQETQAKISLGDAVSMEEQAYLALATLIGQDSVARLLTASSLATPSGDPVPETPYRMISSPSELPRYPHTTPIDLPALLSQAMNNRGDLRATDFGVQMAKHAEREAQGGLYPTIAAIGDYTYASPNQRVFPPTGQFNGTWDLGIQLSFNIGGIPAAVAQTRAAEAGVRRAEIEREKQRSAVTLDVRKTALVLDRARRDLQMVKSLVGRAQESLRIVQQEFDNGAAKHTDVLEAELAVLRVRFSVTNREIDVQIAAADLARAVSMRLP